MIESELDLSRMKEPLEPESRFHRVLVYLRNRYELYVASIGLAFAVCELGAKVTAYLTQWFEDLLN